MKLLGALLACVVLHTSVAEQIESNKMVELRFQAQKVYDNPFMDVEVDVRFTAPDGSEMKVPAFWAGGKAWRARYASSIVGTHVYRTECSDFSDAGLDGVEGQVEIKHYTGENKLYRHGPLKIAADQRHFAHADGTPFFWMGDTWWKCLAKRMTWEGFQELTADRKAKGFSVVQMVCGPYPDEGYFEERWKNEGGFPYTAPGFKTVNPEYFDYADRRIECLVESGIAPAIVGGWGRGDCDAMALAGLDGMKRHWRYLIGRYGAYPAFWIVGGESGGPDWTDLARYVQQIDPYRHPATMHPADSGRLSVTDETVLNFDMLQTGHGGWPAAETIANKLAAARCRKPPMPVLVGEHSYEQHMQTGFADVQRFVFWSTMLSGSAGLTYGAAGIWHASVEGDPGLGHIYDRTTWKDGMGFAGSSQLGYGKKLLEQYPWEQFEPHADWTAAGSFAAGIPGKVRFIYTPNRGVYNWNGLQVKGLEPRIKYRMFYFDPVRGTRDDLGLVMSLAEKQNQPFPGHTEPLEFEDAFDNADTSAWIDHGSPTRREGGCLVGGKNLLTTVKGLEEENLMVSVDAHSNAEAGIVLRFHDPENYVVGLYTPSLKCMYFHDRQHGAWGSPLGRVEIPNIGPNIRLTAAVSGAYAMLIVSDGAAEFRTDAVRLDNRTAGGAGVWFYQIGERQEFDNFAVSKTLFHDPALFNVQGLTLAKGSDFVAPPVPSPQDWVLVLERDAL